MEKGLGYQNIQSAWLQTKLEIKAAILKRQIMDLAYQTKSKTL